MKYKLLPKKNIPQGKIDVVLDIPREKAVDDWRHDKRKAVVVENLMVREYVAEPSATFAECRKAIQPFCPEYRLDDLFISKHAEAIKMKNIAVREAVADWAYGVTKLIYDGMAGDTEALNRVKTLLKNPYDPKAEDKHRIQERAVFFAMFEFIPELRNSRMYDDILFIGKKYINIFLNKIVDVLTFDAGTAEKDEKPVNIEELKREIYLARNELAEYKALVEAEDAEYDDKIEELKRQEISSFFSALNNERYGFIIDTVYLLNRACSELRKRNIELPFSVQGVPALLDRMMRFFKDSGISPVSRFVPHSEQMLTLSQMEGCRFEPSSSRTKPIGEGEKVRVTVLSSGWKYGDIIISQPVLHEKEF